MNSLHQKTNGQISLSSSHPLLAVSWFFHSITPPIISSKKRKRALYPSFSLTVVINHHQFSHTNPNRNSKWRWRREPASAPSSTRHTNSRRRASLISPKASPTRTSAGPSSGFTLVHSCLKSRLVDPLI